MDSLKYTNRVKWALIVVICVIIAVYVRIKSAIGIKPIPGTTLAFTTFVEILLLASVIVITSLILFSLIDNVILKLIYKEQEHEETKNALKTLNAELEKKTDVLNEKISELSITHQVVQSILCATEIKKIVLRILEDLHLRLKYDRGIVYLLNETESTLSPAYSININPDTLKSYNLVTDDNFIVKTALDRRPKIIKSYSSCSFPEFYNSVEIDGLVACVPLEAVDKVIGVLVVDNIDSKRELKEMDLRKILNLINLVGLAIRNAQLFETERKFKEELQHQVDIAVEQLKSAQAQLIQSEKMAALGQMAAIVTHEIRNPLAIIRGAAELINESAGENPQTKKYASFIMHEVDNMSRITRDILSFSQQIKLTLQDVNINNVIKEVLDYIEPMEFMKNDIKCFKDFSDDLPTIKADPERIKQVLLNILQNACHFLSNRLIKNVHIKTFNDGDAVCIEITDTGPGIPQEHLEKIFEPFFTTKSKGTGLGLTISKNIIEAHKGRIEVQSEQNDGTTFLISLPVDMHIQSGSA